MPSIFRAWTYKHVRDALAALNRETLGGTEAFAENLAFAEQCDHWQQGKQWPTFIPIAMRQKVLEKIEPQFRPVDVIGEVLDNVANGLLDKEPAITFTPRVPIPTPDPESVEDVTRAAKEAKQQAAEISAMSERIAAWWDRRKFWEAVRKATRRSRWAGRGALRLWITRNTLTTSRAGDGTETTGLPTGLTPEQALDAVQLMAPSPATGFVYTDPDTQETCGVFLFETGDGVQAQGAGTQTKKHAEIWFLDGEETVIRVVEENGDASAAKEFPLKTGKRLPIVQMTAQLLVTEPVRRQQRTLNYFETLLARVVETAGFPERYTINAMPSGIWLDIPPAEGPPLEVRDVEMGGGTTKTWYLHPVPRELGPMITTDLRGITGQSGTTGGEVIMTPSVTFKDPTDPAYLINACEHGRFSLLRQCKQGHLATDSTAESSGIAYAQARAVFEKDLRGTKSPLEGMVRDIIEAAIALSEAMSAGVDSASFLEKYRCVVNLHVDAGPASSAEMAEYRAQNSAGLLSRESAMAKSGVEDTTAELSALQTDPLALANLRKTQGEAMKALQDGAGATFTGAALAIGITKEDAALLLTPDPIGDETP
jgi:hypothetical protein